MAVSNSDDDNQKSVESTSQNGLLPIATTNIQTTTTDDNTTGIVQPIELDKSLTQSAANLKDKEGIMPILDLSYSGLEDSLESIDSDPLVNETSYSSSIYLRAGVNKTFGSGFENYSGFGQSVGVGCHRQIRPHWMISAELNGSRLRTGDTAQIDGQTAYGFTQFENQYVVTTKELLRANTTLMAHYRIKRLYLGIGVQPHALIALKNETDQSVSNNANQSDVGTSQGYYQWNRYRRLGGNGVIDLQYQIVDDTFLGIRSSCGFNNSLNIDHKTLRLLQFEAYLKLNIR